MGLHRHYLIDSEDACNCVQIAPHHTDPWFTYTSGTNMIQEGVLKVHPQATESSHSSQAHTTPICHRFSLIQAMPHMVTALSVQQTTTHSLPHRSFEGTNEMGNVFTQNVNNDNLTNTRKQGLPPAQLSFIIAFIDILTSPKRIHWPTCTISSLLHTHTLHNPLHTCTLAQTSQPLRPEQSNISSPHCTSARQPPVYDSQVRKSEKGARLEGHRTGTHTCTLPFTGFGV